MRQSLYSMSVTLFSENVEFRRFLCGVDVEKIRMFVAGAGLWSSFSDLMFGFQERFVSSSIYPRFIPVKSVDDLLFMEMDGGVWRI
jgi:hypothetical protein